MIKGLGEAIGQCLAEHHHEKMANRLTPEDEAKRDAWLLECKTQIFKNSHYCGKLVTVADVERWLRSALGPR